MSISMLVTNRRTGDVVEIPVCTNSTFHRYWEQAAKEEGLEMIEALPALWVTSQFHDRFIAELTTLRKWADNHRGTDDYYPEMTRRIDMIEAAIASHPLEEFEVSFG